MVFSYSASKKRLIPPLWKLLTLNQKRKNASWIFFVLKTQYYRSSQETLPKLSLMVSFRKELKGKKKVFR